MWKIVRNLMNTTKHTTDWTHETCRIEVEKPVLEAPILLSWCTLAILFIWSSFPCLLAGRPLPILEIPKTEKFLHVRYRFLQILHGTKCHWIDSCVIDTLVLATIYKVANIWHSEDSKNTVFQKEEKLHYFVAQEKVLVDGGDVSGRSEWMIEGSTL